MSKELLPDERWHEIAFAPHPAPSPKGGRPPMGDRDALRGILFVLKTGIPWQALRTEAFGVSGVSVASKRKTVASKPVLRLPLALL